VDNGVSLLVLKGLLISSISSKFSDIAPSLKSKGILPTDFTITLN
jgi:hypothetical protein